MKNTSNKKIESDFSWDKWQVIVFRFEQFALTKPDTFISFLTKFILHIIYFGKQRTHIIQVWSP